MIYNYPCPFCDATVDDKTCSNGHRISHSSFYNAKVEIELGYSDMPYGRTVYIIPIQSNRYVIVSDPYAWKKKPVYVFEYTIEYAQLEFGDGL